MKKSLNFMFWNETNERIYAKIFFRNYVRFPVFDSLIDERR